MVVVVVVVAAAWVVEVCVQLSATHRSGRCFEKDWTFD